MLGDTVLVLTEPGNKLLSVQLPGASSIQPIKEELQLLCAAWEILLLQLLRIKEIRKKKTTSSHQDPSGPILYLHV